MGKPLGILYLVQSSLPSLKTFEKCRYVSASQNYTVFHMALISYETTSILPYCNLNGIIPFRSHCIAISKKHLEIKDKPRENKTQHIFGHSGCTSDTVQQYVHYIFYHLGF